jgi:hypothetical protein
MVVLVPLLLTSVVSTQSISLTVLDQPPVIPGPDGVAVSSATDERGPAWAPGRTARCLATGNRDECVANPAWVFSSELMTAMGGNGQQAGSAEAAAERVYKAFAAHNVLCPRIETRTSCEASSMACFWDQRRGACAADPHAAFLQPLACPGSPAAAYLSCLRRHSPAACMADSACEVAAAGCLPRALLEGASGGANGTAAQARIEKLAAGILRGDVRVLGSCPEGALLQRVAAMCPSTRPWEECRRTAVCAHAIPPYLPLRAGPGGSSNSPEEIAGGLAYRGNEPAPVCTVDAWQLRGALPRLLGVRPALVRALADADRACSTAETIAYDVQTRTAACGFDSFAYDEVALQRAASSGGSRVSSDVASASSRR